VGAADLCGLGRRGEGTTRSCAGGRNKDKESRCIAEMSSTDRQQRTTDGGNVQSITNPRIRHSHSEIWPGVMVMVEIPSLAVAGFVRRP